MVTVEVSPERLVNVPSFDLSLSKIVHFPLKAVVLRRYALFTGGVSRKSRIMPPVLPSHQRLMSLYASSEPTEKGWYEASRYSPIADR